MCARFSLTAPLESLRRLFGFTQSPNIRPRYNIAPTQQIWALRPDGTQTNAMELFPAKWGLIPSWSKTPENAPRLINARSETVAQKPSFRSAYKSQRCLIPANSFFEWQKTGKSSKQAWRIGLQNWELFAFAGLWENWHSPAGEQIQSCTILTTAANDALSGIHTRMPVIISPDDYKSWLSCHSDEGLLKPYPSEQMAWYKVGPKVGNVRNDSADLLEPDPGEMPLTPSLF